MKNALLYMFMVGGSVAAVIALLVAGEDLRAPQSVGGTWVIEGAPTASCSTLELPAQSPSFKISQSGPHLDILLNDKKRTDLRGALDGSALTAETRGSRASVRLEGSAEADRFTGSLAVAGCADKIPIVAVRQRPAPKKGGGGH